MFVVLETVKAIDRYVLGRALILVYTLVVGCMFHTPKFEKSGGMFGHTIYEIPLLYQEGNREHLSLKLVVCHTFLLVVFL